jgi:ribosomal subunit interface protein
MRLTAHFKSEEFRPQIEKDLERYREKLSRWLKHYNEDLVSLHLTYEKHPRKQEYTVSLDLRLPSADIPVSATHADARFALRQAFDELEEQIKKHQGRLRRDYLWKRRRARQASSRPESGTTEPGE